LHKPADSVLFEYRDKSNLRRLTLHSMPFAPQHRDRNVAADYCDVTSSKIYTALQVAIESQKLCGDDF